MKMTSVNSDFPPQPWPFKRAGNISVDEQEPILKVRKRDNHGTYLHIDIVYSLP